MLKVLALTSTILLLALVTFTGDAFAKSTTAQEMALKCEKLLIDPPNLATGVQ
jgi:hypothetical protein